MGTGAGREKEVKEWGGWKDLEGLGSRAQELFVVEARQNRKKEGSG